MSETIIPTETNQQLESTAIFSQYALNWERLITLIGELHEKTWKCDDDDSLTIINYCELAVKRNPKCKIFLEFNPGVTDISQVGSGAIRGIMLALQRLGKTSAVVPFDFRSFFLTPKGQDELYSDGFYQYTTWESIGQRFIEPFFIKQREDPNLLQPRGEYEISIRNYFTQTYVPDMVNTFHRIAETFGKVPVEEIHQKLKSAWKKVADFYLLTIMLRKDIGNELIVLAGKAHISNIRPILQGIGQELVFQSADGSNCVKLYGTYEISKES